MASIQLTPNDPMDRSMPVVWQRLPNTGKTEQARRAATANGLHAASAKVLNGATLTGVDWRVTTGLGGGTCANE